MHLQWRDILEIGVEEMDADHRHLVELLNRVQDASEDDDRQAALEILYQLEQFTADHFAREEAMMAQIHYRLADQHRQEHQRLFYEVKAQIADLERGRIVAGAVSVFLQRWLLRHIAGADSLLGAALIRERECPALPQSGVVAEFAYGNGSKRQPHAPVAE